MKSVKSTDSARSGSKVLKERVYPYGPSLKNERRWSRFQESEALPAETDYPMHGGNREFHNWIYYVKLCIFRRLSDDAQQKAPIKFAENGDQ